MEIVPLGDSALIVRVREEFEDTPEETLNEVLQTFQQMRSAAIPGVIELAPAYTSVAVFFHPVDVAKASGTASDIFDWLAARISAATVPKRRGSRRSAPRTVEIPVCYDPEFAPDLDEVARHARISTKEVVDLHSAADYRVACIGFVPGFPFMAGLPKKIATPRRSNPRKEIPPGAVGIGGAQTKFIRCARPGLESDWTYAVGTFDPTKDPPVLLRAGDRGRFARSHGKNLSR
jgi:inhibitor of KinA